MTNRELLSGNEAIARGAWEAGVDFGSGYPGTPSSEILPALAGLGIKHIEWSVNEKCALEAAAGASIAGARCLVTMKHVGVNVAADALFTLAYTGVGGGLVFISADDPGMHSSQNEQDNRHYGRSAQIPVIEPSDSEEARVFTRRAYEISEQFDLPVMLRVTTRICHSDTPVNLEEREELGREYEPTYDREKYVMIPGHARGRHADRLERWRKLRAFAEETELNETIDGDSDLGVISSGVAYEYAREVLPGASFLKLGLVWPMPEQTIREFVDSVDELIVIEESGRFLADNIRMMGLEITEMPESIELGELSPWRVDTLVNGGDDPGEPKMREDLPPRPPTLCAGCPHRGAFHALRKMKVHVTGDIGCYTLGTLPPLSSLHTCLCMGASVGEAHGINSVCGEKKSVAVIGDSTFMHSGITGLVNIVYNAGNSVVCVLDNGTTAMTGGQDHPATGRTLSGKPAREVTIEDVCRGAGIENVTVVDPMDLEETEKTLREAMASDEPAVVIARRMCVLACHERGEPFWIEEGLCVQCGQCLRLGCPAIGTEGDQPIIDQTQCTGCTLCAQVCPVDAIGQRKQETISPDDGRDLI